LIANGEVKWYLAASPGIARATDLGLTLSSIALGYTRDFQNSLGRVPRGLVKQIRDKTPIGLSREQPVQEKFRRDSRHIAILEARELLPALVP